MIQRIQTVYLFFASLVLLLPLRLPFAVFSGPGGEATYKLFDTEFYRKDGSVLVSEPVLLSPILTVISIIGLLTGIFLYKKRKIQLATVYSMMFSQVAILASFAVTIYQANKSYLSEALGLEFSAAGSYGMAAPVLALLLTYLAARGIKKDEALVRSADRIR